MPWVKGQSGNPGGRAKGVKQVQDAARAHTTLAIDTLASIARDPEQPGRARVAAAEVILDRGWGKAPQKLELEGLSQLPDNVIDAILTACDLIESGKLDAARPARTAPSSDGSEGETAH